MSQLICVVDLIKNALKQAVINKCYSLGKVVCVEYEDDTKASTNVNANAKTINTSITLSPDEFIQTQQEVIVQHDCIIQVLSSELMNDILANNQVHELNKIILSNIHIRMVDLNKACKINMEVSYRIN